MILTTGAILTGCPLFDDRCGDESRSVTALAGFPGPANATGFAQVQLVEHRTEEPRQTLWWVVEDSAFTGQITGAQLVLATDPTRVLVDLPVIPGPGQVLLHGELQPYVGPTPFHDLYQDVLTNQVDLVLETTAAGYTRLLLPLRLFESPDWSRPHCS
jgi:hypothetical protein